MENLNNMIEFTNGDHNRYKVYPDEFDIIKEMDFRKKCIRDYRELNQPSDKFDECLRIKIEDGRITKLNIYRNNLVLPDSLKELQYLNELVIVGRNEELKESKIIKELINKGVEISYING